MHVERMKITNEFISLYKASSKEVAHSSKAVVDDVLDLTSVDDRVPSPTSSSGKKRKVQRYKLL